MMATEDSFTGPVNLGNPDEFTMLELAERIIRLTGSQSEIVFRPLPSDDPKQRKPDINLLGRSSETGILPFLLRKDLREHPIFPEFVKSQRYDSFEGIGDITVSLFLC